MASYTFYVHRETGTIAPLPHWRSHYEATNPETWHGKPADECDPKLWLDDGKLHAIELFLEGKCFITERTFPGCRMEAKDGEQYVAEWACKATDIDGGHYQIVWQFTTTKGAEPEEADGWPWDEMSCVYQVQAESTDARVPDELN